jgi:alkylation response protein AidB-like acyl-CoA dehydrogenase
MVRAQEVTQVSKPQQSKSTRSAKLARDRARSDYLAKQRELRHRLTRHALTPEQARAIAETRAVNIRARIVEADAQQRVDAAIIKLRSLGLSWDQVASAFDLTRQGAMKRHAAAVTRVTSSDQS